MKSISKFVGSLYMQKLFKNTKYTLDRKSTLDSISKNFLNFPKNSSEKTKGNWSENKEEKDKGKI